MFGTQRQGIARHGHRFVGTGLLHQLDRHGRVLRPFEGRTLAVLPDLLHGDLHRLRRHRHRVAIVVILPLVPDLDLVLAGVRNALVARRAALHRRVLRHFLRRSGILRPRVDVQLCAEAHLHIVPAHCLRRIAGDTHRQRLACNVRLRRHCRAGTGYRAVHRMVVRRAKVNHRHAIADKLHRAVQRVRDLYLVRILRHIRHQLILIARVECSKLCMHVLIYILLDLRRLAQRVRHRIGHRASLRIRRVRDRRAVILRHARHARLRHAVDDQLAVRVLRKRLELPAGGFRVQGQRLPSHSRPVAVRLRHKLDRHDGIVRPRERPAPGVLPNLPDRRFCRLRRMLVRQRRDRAFGAVARQRIAVKYTVLRPGVGDRLAITLQWQVVDRRCPFVRRFQRHGPNHRLAVLQLHAQARRPLAVLVVVVVPDLPDCRGGLSGRVAVRQRRDCAVHADIRQRITLRQAALGPGVADFSAVCVLRQAGDRRAPAVRLVQRHFLTVRQCHRQACRTLAVLVIVVVPDLLDRRFCCLRRMLVRQRRDRALGALARQRIAVRYTVLRPGVGDRLAITLQRQVVDRRRPFVRRVQRHRPNHLLAVLQLHAQARRPLAVLVVVVVPDLPDFNIHGCKRIGDGQAGRSRAVLRLAVGDGLGQRLAGRIVAHLDLGVPVGGIVGHALDLILCRGLRLFDLIVVVARLGVGDRAEGDLPAVRRRTGAALLCSGRRNRGNHVGAAGLHGAVRSQGEGVFLCPLRIGQAVRVASDLLGDLQLGLDLQHAVVGKRCRLNRSSIARGNGDRLRVGAGSQAHALRQAARLLLDGIRARGQLGDRYGLGRAAGNGDGHLAVRDGGIIHLAVVDRRVILLNNEGIAAVCGVGGGCRAVHGHILGDFQGAGLFLVLVRDRTVRLHILGALIRAILHGVARQTGRLLHDIDQFSRSVNSILRQIREGCFPCYCFTILVNCAIQRDSFHRRRGRCCRLLIRAAVQAEHDTRPTRRSRGAICVLPRLCNLNRSSGNGIGYGKEVFVLRAGLYLDFIVFGYSLSVYLGLDNIVRHGNIVRPNRHRQGQIFKLASPTIVLAKRQSLL